MKIKIFFVALACGFLYSCASAPREKEMVTWTGVSEEALMRTTRPLGEQTVTFNGLTYDRVYDACEKTLVRLGYRFFIADKSIGRIRVTGTAKSEFSELYVQPTKTSHLLILVRKTDGGVAVQSGSLTSNFDTPEPLAEKEAKNEVDRFFKGLRKELK